ncbi:hypothetical protein Tco_0580457 [Tanacetum coccineum]
MTNIVPASPTDPPNTLVSYEVAFSTLGLCMLIKFENRRETAAKFLLKKGMEIKVFILVSNVQQKFLLRVSLKNPAVTLIDSKKEGYKVTRKKKKNDDIDDMRVALILQRIFGHYLYAINHVKAVQIIECQIVRGNFTWKTDRREKDCGIFLMRHMECYMGGDIGKWKCDLDVEGKKQNTQLGHLRNKYAAKLLLSDCNINKDKIREEMDGK